MTVAELLSRISSAELTEWMAFSMLEPIGHERGDLQAAVVAATMANINRKKGKKPFKPADFMPKFNGAEQAQDDTERAVEMSKMFRKADE